ncbi:dihydroneopterin aldolase [Roseomonas genomospecies 6]|uniref:dihydroneopterin aldolase n=1 Tax=Roseomonas genomospecies 6 TaxID=214106 RepID=A0A9W7NPB1_9PROT|nr:dihydroneopterin aldolase [Roseomonas genomospecies 6]
MALSTRCFVRDLVMDSLIGVYAHERVKPQRVRLNLDLEVAAPGVTGEDMAAVAKGLVSQGHVTLIETLAERIAERCLADERIAAVKVRVEKLDVFPDAASVGVEIERARA